MRALARQERPRAADAATVERTSISVFAVDVLFIAPPRWTIRRVDLEQGIDHARRVPIRGSSEARRPKRTNASASGLTVTPCATASSGGRLDRHETVGRDAASA